MGYCVVGDLSTGPWEVYDAAGWQFIPHHGHPQQVYGEPFPASDWIRKQVHAIFAKRKAGQYRQADATRQWLRDYGVIVEYERDRVRAKW